MKVELGKLFRWLRVLPIWLLLPLQLWAGGVVNGEFNNLFADSRALQVGDVLTVIISESASGSNQATAVVNKNDKLQIGLQGSDKLGFIPVFGATGDNKNEHKADGSNRRSNHLSGRISVRVTAVEPNGFLTIEGVRTIEIDGEIQVLSVSGTIRPQDVGNDNTIYSHLIANARISYTGKGDLARVQKPGLVNRILSWLF